MRRIFGIGTVVMDHVVVLPNYPERDTKSNVQLHWRQIGGPVPVALSTAVFYGSQASFLGRWGLDGPGNEIATGLDNRGIDISPSDASEDWSTGFAHVWTEETRGSRTIAYSRGELPLPSAADVNRHAERLANAQILHLDGWACDAAVCAAKQMKGQGGIVVLDAGSKKPGMETLLPYVDLLIASSLFCRSWFGDEHASLDQLLELGCGSAIQTRGEQGAVFSDGQRQIEVPAIDVDPVDTNGAGDIFAGAYVHGLTMDWDAERTMKFANAVAGYACGQRGNSRWPTRQWLESVG